MELESREKDLRGRGGVLTLAGGGRWVAAALYIKEVRITLL